MVLLDALKSMLDATGLVQLSPGNVFLIFVGVVLVYLAIHKKYEPFLLLPIGFLELDSLRRTAYLDSFIWVLKR